MLATINDKKSTLRRKIIKNLFFLKELSCNELSELIGKSIPFTTQLLNEMITAGQVVESGYAISTGGRRPQMYSLPGDAFYIISVAMDQLITRITLISTENRYIGQIEKYDLQLANNPNSLDELIQHLKTFLKKIKIPVKNIVGIGIGMPGFVDAASGINHTFLAAQSGTIVSQIEEALGIPVMIDNDSSLIALAELKWGAAKEKQQVMVINIGWGVGLGIIADGKLFRGKEGFAGEFSHIPIFENNKQCGCGKYGCLETETSMVVVAQNVIRGIKEGKPSTVKNVSEDNIEDAAKKIVEAVNNGDKFSIEELSKSAYQIGRGVAILIHLLNPELIVISGIGSLAGKAWIAPIQQAINEHCIPKIAENVEIKISNLGYHAELIGAAALVMDNYELIRPKQISKSILKKERVSG